MVPAPRKHPMCGQWWLASGLENSRARSCLEESRGLRSSHRALFAQQMLSLGTRAAKRCPLSGVSWGPWLPRRRGNFWACWDGGNDSEESRVGRGSLSRKDQQQNEFRASLKLGGAVLPGGRHSLLPGLELLWVCSCVLTEPHSYFSLPLSLQLGPFACTPLPSYFLLPPPFSSLSPLSDFFLLPACLWQGSLKLDSAKHRGK